MYRNATKEDAPLLKKIARDVIRNNYTPFLGEASVNGFIDSGASDAEIDDGLNNCVIMEENSTIVGFVITNDSTLHLIMIAVGYQNQGCGAKLLAYVEKQMFCEHVEIKLQAFVDNVPAIRFYHNHGWVLEENQPVDRSPIKVCHLRKPRPT